MSELISYRCDICQCEKQKTNHWWKGYLIDAGALHEGKIDPAGFMIIPWDVERFSTPFHMNALPVKPDAHLCGEQCAIAWASRQFSKPSPEIIV